MSLSKPIVAFPLNFPHFPLTLPLSSVTITSILRVTAVANSGRNQADQTWNFIPRGVWTLVEANLGIICTCLPVLKQLVKRLFPSMFSTTKATPSGGRYGYGSNNPKSNRGPASRLPDDVEDEYDMHGQSRRNKSYRMSSMGYIREPSSEDERRKSDEKHIISTSDTQVFQSDRSIEGEDSWSANNTGTGIKVTKTVDVQIDNRVR